MKTMPSIMYDYALNRPNKVINHISPSSVGRCMRAHYYDILHVPHTTPPNVGALLNFEVGFLWEEVMHRALQSSDLPFMYQLPLSSPTLNLKGTLDFAIYDKDTDAWVIQDSKTEMDAAGVYRRKRKMTFFEDHPEYVHQLNSYCLLMRDNGFKVSGGGFTIISKGNGSITEELNAFPEDSLKATVDRITTLQGYLTRKEVPPCECEGWKIGYCNRGKPSTRKQNTTKKWVNTECCPSGVGLAYKWAKLAPAEKVVGV